MPPTTNLYETALDQALSDEKMTRDRIEKLRHQIVAEEARTTQIAGLVDALMAAIPVNSRAFYAGKLAGIRPPMAKTNRGGTAYEAITALVEQLPHRKWSAPEIQEALKSTAGLIVEIEQVHNVLNYLCRRERLTRTSRGQYVPVGMARALEHIEEQLAS